MFFTPRLGGGGAEMQLIRVANHLDRDEFAPEIAVSRVGDYETRVDDSIPIHHLAPRIKSSFGSLAASAIPLRRLVRRRAPDVVCSFMDIANVVAAVAVDRRNGGPPVVGCVQNTISLAYGKGERRIARIVPPLVRRIYPSLDRIIALSHGAAEDLSRYVPAAAPLMTVIHNAGVDDTLAARAAEPVDLPPRRASSLIVACGRLAPQKGYPHLLEGLATIRRELDAELWICGEGPSRSALEAQIRKLGLQDAVRLLGFQKNPYAYMAAADVFVLSSIYEGFGNVVVEAMGTGRAVVSTDCPHGPREIITEGVDGMLVPPADAEALAAALSRVLTEPGLAKRLGAAALTRANDFHVKRIAAQYGDELRRIAGR